MNLNVREEILLKNYLPKEKEIRSMANLFYAFSDDTRLRIIILLSIRAFCVSDITEMLKINQTTVSHQLKILKAQNLVECFRSGKNIFYSIKNSNVENLLSAGVDCI